MATRRRWAPAAISTAWVSCSMSCSPARGRFSVAQILAKVLYEEPARPSVIRPEIGPQLEAICCKAMAKHVTDRFRTMGDFAAALGSYLKGTEVGKISPAPGAVTSRRRALWPWLAAAG